MNRSDSIRLAELLAALSVASDLGMGQPLDYALGTCILSTRLAEAIGLSEDKVRDVYYLALLRHIGCNAETHAMATLFGDELALRTELATADTGDMARVMRLFARYIRQANDGASAFTLARVVAQGVMTTPAFFREEFAGFCEVAQRLAQRMGMNESLLHALGHVFERWDGKGFPAGIKGEAIALSMRIVSLAQDALTFHRLEGVDAAIAIARKRKGSAYDPEIVECFSRSAKLLCADLEAELSWEVVLALEPGAQVFLSDEQFDAACQAIADFADIKSPYTLGHSSGVARLASGAARGCGLTEKDAIVLHRAGLLHDIGRVGISAGIWGKPGPLTEREWERVRLHPYYTERVLARSSALAQLGTLAGYHHERLDGSGYYRGIRADNLSAAARLLAAADVYHAITEPRPHRPARTGEEAVAEVQREVRAGRLDSEAVNAVLMAAGHHVPPRRRPRVADLSEREIEVLRLIARGHTMRQIADLLTLSKKTVDNHIQHIYNKTGVTTRAGATLFAMEQGLLAEGE